MLVVECVHVFIQHDHLSLRHQSSAATEQGDKEATRGLAVSPLCNRSDQNLPKSQCDFIDFIVRPCVTIFSVYCKVSETQNVSRFE